MSSPRLPPFRDLLKSREVEDPVNLYVHRPLAYAFVALVFRTPLTPNGVTLLATLVGIASGAAIIHGARESMVLGGVLLWVSAILDGADGILARAKHMQSQFGRAVDGMADAVVAAATVLPMFWHLWQQQHELLHVVLLLPAILSALVHLYTYDYYKESFLRMTRLQHGGEGEDAPAVEKRLEQAEARQGGLGVVTRLAVSAFLLPFLRAQTAIVRLTNPMALREGVRFVRNEETARIYRHYNRGPMRLWAVVSLAPHSYLLAICAMFDSPEAYLWIRLGVMNVICCVAMVWQRWATQQTFARLQDMGAGPMPATSR